MRPKPPPPCSIRRSRRWRSTAWAASPTPTTSDRSRSPSGSACAYWPRCPRPVTTETNSPPPRCSRSARRNFFPDAVDGALAHVAGLVHDCDGAADEQVARRFVGRPGMRMRRSATLRVAKLGSELHEPAALDARPHLREQLLLLFLHVVADTLDQHGRLGVKALGGRSESLQLAEQPLHHVVLFQRLEHGRFLFGNLTPDRGIEHHLLDRGMPRERLDHRGDERALGLVGILAGLLEALEQLLDLAVIL